MKIKCISKSLISLIVAFALFLGAGIMALTNLTSKPTNRVSAAAQIIEGSSVTWEYNSSTHALTIAGTGDMPNFDWDENDDSRTTAPWWDIRQSVESISIGQSVTKIGELAFFEFSELESIVFPETLTNGVGPDAFRYCVKLKEILWNIPNCPDISYSGCFESVGSSTSGVTVTFGNNVVSIPARLFVPEDDTESGNLKEVILGDMVQTIGEYAFCRAHTATGMKYYYDLTSISVLSGSYGETWARAAGYTEPVLVVRPASGGEDTGVIANIVLPSILAVTLSSIILMYAFGLKKRKHI